MLRILQQFKHLSPFVQKFLCLVEAFEFLSSFLTCFWENIFLRYRVLIESKLGFVRIENGLKNLSFPLVIIYCELLVFSEYLFTSEQN